MAVIPGCIRIRNLQRIGRVGVWRMWQQRNSGVPVLERSESALFNRVDWEAIRLFLEVARRGAADPFGRSQTGGHRRLGNLLGGAEACRISTRLSSPRRQPDVRDAIGRR